jgi:hypothetical protein
MTRFLFRGFGIFTVMSCLGTNAVCGWERAEFKLTVYVCDDTGLPVPSARIRGGIWSPEANFADIASGRRKDLIYEGTTNTGGLYIAHGHAWQDMGWNVEKDGFYSTHGGYNFLEAGTPAIVKGRFQPWNATNTVVLKRIRNPIPMYAKGVETVVPVLGQPVGYDLEKGDWVGPHGKGVVSDLVFTVTGTYKDPSNGQVLVGMAFSNPLDGIQTTHVEAGPAGPVGSKFWSLHEAPEDNYAGKYNSEFLISSDPGVLRKNPSRDHGAILYYRVRVCTNETGQIVRALYGKIYGQMCGYFKEVHPPENTRIGVRFSYYLNPTPNDRNVEFDPKRNLMKYFGRGEDPLGDP